MIYFDHAATAPLHPKAKEAMAEAMEVLGNPSSLHTAGSGAKRLLEQSRATVAEALGCEPAEILFTSGGTEANALALHGRRKILASPMEHPSVAGNVKGTPYLPVTPKGVVSLEKAEALLREGVDLVSLQHANNETGLIQPIEELGALCQAYGVPFHSDGVQAVGKLPIRLHRLPISLYSFSAHKFGGPAGIGGLYRKSGTAIEPLYRGGMQEQGLRPGTESVLSACGMAAALQAVTEELAETAAYLTDLGEELLRGLCAFGAVPTGEGDRIPGHLHVSFPHRDGEALVSALDLRGVCLSAGAACHSHSHTPSSTLLAMGFAKEEASAGLRITLGRENTRQEVQTFLGLLADCLK
ncbi:MAG: cysteine desulfurase [Clostridia bacterium]|nr:cysteine desulfurase [Clostridia bacterium]